MLTRRRAAILCFCLFVVSWFIPGANALGGAQQATAIVLRPTTTATIRLLPVPRAAEPADGPVDEPQPPLPFFDVHASALESRLFADAVDRKFDEFRLIEAGLVASGVQRDDRLAHYRKRFETLADELQESLDPKDIPRRRAAAVFEFLHRRVLTGQYQLECTDLRTALDEGRFNCVSASMLFCCLTETCGLDVCGLEMPGHAMARLRLSGEVLDVEATCRRWFRLLDDPAGQAEAVQRTLGTDLSARYAQAREVSPVEMAAMIYYNRGVDLLMAKRFDEAAVANAKALRLDPSSTTARGNLLATVNNWAIALSAEGRYDEASALLHDGMQYDAGFEAFSLNYVHVHHEWVESLCETGQYEEAAALLEQATAERPDLDYFRQSSQDVYRRWIASLRAAGRSEEADRAAGRRQGEGRHDRERAFNSQ